MNCFKKIDIISPEVKLNVKGLESYKSVYGGILSLLLAALSILAFCAFGRDIIEKQSPIIQLNTKDNPDRIYHYNSSAFTIMFAITDNVNLLPIKEVTKKMKLYFNVRNTNATNASSGTSGNNLIDININLIPCTKENADPDVFSNLIVDISNYWCVPQNVTYDLINGLGEGTSQWFRIQHEICKNTTENKNSCYSADEIYKEFAVINVHYVLSDNFIDGYDYYDPGKKTFISGLLKGGSNTWTRTVFWYKNVFYNTDTNWILESFRNQVYLQNNQLDKEIYYQEKTKVFFSHLISITKKADYFNRSYLKIQGAFAYIGGFITFFRVFFSYINNLIVKQDILLIFDANYNKKKESKVNNLHDSRNFINVQNNDKSILENSNQNMVNQVNLKANEREKIMNQMANIKNKPDIQIQKKFTKDNFKDKKINFLLFVLPCLIKKTSESRKIYDHTQWIKQIYKKYFSLEKLVKTIKNVKNINSHLKENNIKSIIQPTLFRLNVKKDES